MYRWKVNCEIEYNYVLLLNPMTGNTENCVEFGPFPTVEAARAFYDAEKVELYEDMGPDFFSTVGGTEKKYRKTFRKGGPLEWVNPIPDMYWTQPDPHYNHGLHEIVARVFNVERMYQIS